MSNLIHKGWKEANLADISKVSIGLVTSMTKHYVEDGVPLIRNSDIKKNRIRQSQLINLNPTFAQENESRSIRYRDVVTVHTGDIGTSAVVPPELDGCQGFATLNTRVDEDKLNPYFLSWFFNTDVFTNFCMSVSTGDGRNNLNLKDFVNAKILYPPLPEQKKIAAILTSVDNVIEKTQAQIDKLKDLKTGMMQELLTKGIGHTEFKESPVGRIPVEWEVVKFSDVLEKIDSGWSPSCIEIPPKTGEWGVLKVSAVTRGKFLEEQSKTLPKNLEPRERIRIQCGDILLTRANGVAALVGKCVMVRREPKSKLMMSDKILRLNPMHLIDSNYLLHYFNSQMTRKQIELSWGGSSGQKNISQADIKSYKLALPPIEEQKKIAHSITQVEHFLDAKGEKLKGLVRAKKALMQDLLTGKVRVKL